MAVSTQALPWRMTIEEYFALPDDVRAEYEEGELIEMAAPHWRHQQLATEIASALGRYIKEQQAGIVLPTINFQLSSVRNYIPDVVFIHRDHLDRLSDDTGRLHGPADLVVEIHSTESAGRDRITKFAAYYAAGVEWYWLVDRDALTIEEYHAGPDGYVRTAGADRGKSFQPRVFPNFQINLEESLGAGTETEAAETPA